MTTPTPEDINPEDAYQLFRAELLQLHNHKISISGFRGERSCHRKPVRANPKRVGLKLRVTAKGKARAFFSQTQRSTSYSCPIAHHKARAAKDADMRYLAEMQFERGGVVLSGTFGMKVTPKAAPSSFYDPKESFRASDEWERVEQTAGKLGSIHEYMQTSGWVDFLALHESDPSYLDWDLNRRLDAAGEGISFMFNARDFVRIQKRVGVTVNGYAVATEIEVTPSKSRDPQYSAWWGVTRNNVHVHFVLYLDDSSVTTKQINALKRALHARWSAAVTKHGFVSLLAGSSLKLVSRDDLDYQRASRYIVKGTKFSDDPARLGASYWDALRASMQGDTVATAWWMNFEGAVRGRRMFRISKSMMDSFDLKGERERRAEAWKASSPQVLSVAFFDRTDWYLVTSTTPKMRERLLLVAEQLGADGAREWLEEKGIPFYLEELRPEDSRRRLTRDMLALAS